MELLDLIAQRIDPKYPRPEKFSDPGGDFRRGKGEPPEFFTLGKGSSFSIFILIANVLIKAVSGSVKTMIEGKKAK